MTTLNILLVAALGIALVLPKLRLEMRWNQKQAAYDRVLNALHEMHELLDHDIEVVVGMRGEPDDAVDDDNAKQYNAARREVRRCAVLGEYLFSAEAKRRLREYLKALQTDPEDPWHEQRLFKHEADTRNCIDDMIVVARRDLSVVPMWWFALETRYPRACGWTRRLRDWDSEA